MKDFKLNAASVKWFITELYQMLLDGKTYRVDIKLWRNKRTIDQNSLMWVWLKEIELNVECGGSYYSDETWHLYFKKYYCPSTIIPLPVGQTSVKSTKLLDTGQMHHYLFQIEQWAAEHMLVLTTPDDSEYKKLKMEQVK